LEHIALPPLLFCCSKKNQSGEKAPHSKFSEQNYAVTKH